MACLRQGLLHGKSIRAFLSMGFYSFFRSLAFFLCFSVQLSCGTSPSVNSQDVSEVKSLPAVAGVAAVILQSFSVHIDLNDLISKIDAKVLSARNRPGFVRSLAYNLFYGSKERLNVVVFNLNQDHDFDLQGVQFYATVDYGGIKYGTWAFKSGTFLNKGDGGFINWALVGYHDKVTGDGKKFVTFSPSPEVLDGALVANIEN